MTVPKCVPARSPLPVMAKNPDTEKTKPAAETPPAAGAPQSAPPPNGQTAASEPKSGAQSEERPTGSGTTDEGPAPSPGASPAGEGAAAGATATPDEGPATRSLMFTASNNARSAWARARDAGHNLIGAGTIMADVPQGLGYAFNVVRIDARPMNEGGEVYPIQGGQGKLGLGKVALYKLATLAGVNWSADESGRMDDGRDDRYAHWKAVGYVLDPFTNRMRYFVGEKVMDVRPGSTQYRTYLNEARRKARKDLGKDADDAAVEDRARGALQRRLDELTPHLTSHAETKAQLRAIRSGLGLHTSYTREQLAKPFVVPTLVSAPETIQDPVLRRDMMRVRIEAAMGLRDTLYGRGRGQLASQGARVENPLPPPQPAPNEPSTDPVDEDELVE